MTTKKKKTKPSPLKAATNGDVVIVIGKATKAKVAQGVAVWSFGGEEQTEHGDRFAVARVTPQQLFKLGWIRRK